MSDWRPSDDLREVADGLEAVTLVRRDGQRLPLSGALRRAVEGREWPATGGQVLRSDVTWHLSTSELEQRPELGEQLIEASGRVWTVMGTMLATLGTRWSAWCRSIEIACGLDQRATIQRAVLSKGAHGEPAVVWEDWRSDIPVRVQPVEGGAAVELGHRLTRATHWMYTLETLELGHEHRVAHAGRGFKVTGFRQAERLGMPAVVEMVLDPWPL